MFHSDRSFSLEFTGTITITAREFAELKDTMIIGHFVKVCQAKIREGFLDRADAFLY